MNAGAEARMMPEGDCAGGWVCPEVGLQPTILRGGWAGRDVAIEPDQVPGAEVITVVAAPVRSRQGVEIGEVRCGTGRAVIAIAGDGASARPVAPPGGE